MVPKVWPFGSFDSLIPEYMRAWLHVQSSLLTHDPCGVISWPPVFDSYYANMVGWEILLSVMSRNIGRKRVDTPKAVPNPVNNPEALGCNVCPSITSQTQSLPQKGKGLVKCVYKQCPTGLQLARWHNQINTCAKCACLPWRCIFIYSSCSEEDVLGFYHCYIYRLLLVPKCCNVSCAEVLQHDWTSLYSAADIACIQFFAEEGLARKTMYVQTLEAITFARQ